MGDGGHALEVGTVPSVLRQARSSRPILACKGSSWRIRLSRVGVGCGRWCCLWWWLRPIWWLSRGGLRRRRWGLHFQMSPSIRCQARGSQPPRTRAIREGVIPGLLGSPAHEWRVVVVQQPTVVGGRV